MALVYFDSSALVALCVESPRSNLAARLWRGADLACTSYVARVQVAAALGQARRADLLDAEALSAALETWQEVQRQLFVVEASPASAERAAALVLEYDIRADDAWHLVAAELLLAAGGVAAMWDARLSAAAAREGIALVA